MNVSAGASDLPPLPPPRPTREMATSNPSNSPLHRRRREGDEQRRQLDSRRRREQQQQQVMSASAGASDLRPLPPHQPTREMATNNSNSPLQRRSDDDQLNNRRRREQQQVNRPQLAHRNSAVKVNDWLESSTNIADPLLLMGDDDPALNVVKQCNTSPQEREDVLDEADELLTFSEQRTSNVPADTTTLCALHRVIVSQLLDAKRPFIVGDFIESNPANLVLLHEPITVDTLMLVLDSEGTNELPVVKSRSSRNQTTGRRKDANDTGDNAAGSRSPRGGRSGQSDFLAHASRRDLQLLLQRCDIASLARNGETLATLLQFDAPSDLPLLQQTTLVALAAAASKGPLVTAQEIENIVCDDIFLNPPPQNLSKNVRNAEKTMQKMADRKTRRVARVVDCFMKYACAPQQTTAVGLDKEGPSTTNTSDSHTSSSDTDDSDANDNISVINVSSIIVLELVQKLLQPTERIRFSRKFASDLVHTMRTLGSSILYLALLIIVIVWVATLDLWPRYASWLSATSPGEAWENYCSSGGGVVNGFCHMEWRDLENNVVSAVEAARYFQNEVIASLWMFAEKASISKHTFDDEHNNNVTLVASHFITAALVPYEGSLLVGALLLRLSPSVTDPPAAAPRYTCASNNISVAVDEPYLSTSFDCSSWNTVVIPFNTTKEDALDLAQHFVLQVPEWTLASLVMQYAMYNPSNGNVVWSTISLGVPRYGGIVPRFRIEVLDTTLHDLILTCVIASSVLVAADLLVFIALFTYQDGFGAALFNVCLRLSLFGFVVGSYSMIDSLPPIDSILQAEYVTSGLDAVVVASQQSELRFGIWIFLLIAIVTQFIGHIEGLHTVVKLVAIILPELLGLFVVFAFFYMGFLMVAMIAFGSTIDMYASFFNTNAALIQYFFLNTDLDSFVENYPQTGFTFYYIFRCFLLFVVTNFCIVTIIAPIKSVWLEGDLPVIVANVWVHSSTKSSGAPSTLSPSQNPEQQRRRTDVGSSQLRRKSIWEKFYGYYRVYLRRAFLIAVSIAVFFLNSTPLFLRHWLRFTRILDDLYRPHVALPRKITAAHHLLNLYENHSDTSPYASEMLAVTRTTRAAHTPASLDVSIAMIASESSFEWIRDARLLFMLNSFDEFSTRIQVALDVEEEDKEEVAPLVSREDITASVQDVEWQNENAFQRQRAPTQAEQTISVVNINDDEIEDDKDEDVIADVHQATPPSHQFYFTHFILEQLMETDFFNERYFLLYTISHRIVLIAMYIVMLLTVTNTRRDVSYLTKNLHSGLRDLPYRQSCNDVNCTVGFTKRWTFSDNERLEHLRMFAHRRLQYSLFRTSIPSAAQSDETVPNFSGLADDEVVSWDSYIVRNGPIEIRQMRGKKIECPPLPAFVAQILEDAPHAEQQRLRTFNCSSALDMQQDLWLPKPEGSLLDEDAYRFQAEYCAEDPIQKTFTVHGFYNTHWPCMGYTATVHNASQLLYAIDHWLSGDTRFVAIAMKFSSSGKGNATVLSTKALVESAVSVQYVMYAEFAQGGASGQFFVRTTALKDPFLDTLSDTGIVLMSIDFAFGLIGVLIPLLYAYRHARQRLHKKRILSLRTAVYIIYIGLVSDHLRNSGDAGGDNSSTTAVLAALILVVWLTLAILFDVIFPAALFVFRRVTIVNDFIALAFLRVVQLVPLFSILVTAFTIAGHIMWGSRMHEFATLYHSLLAVLEGLLGDFDLVDDMFALDATYAFVFTLLMLVVMVILALNLLLAVIAGCAEEAREHTKIVGAIEAVAAIMNRRVYFGPMFGVLMGKFLGKSKKRERLPLNAAVATAAANASSQGARNNSHTTIRSKKPLSPLQYEAAKNNLERILERRSLPVKGVFGFLLRFLFPSENGFRARLMRSLFRSTSTAAYADEAPTLHDATLLPPLELHTTEVARLPLPLECLAQHIPPLLFYELVDCLHIGRQPESMQCSSVAFLLQQFQVFSKHFPERSYLDSLKESALSKQLRSKPQRRPITSSLKQGACLQQNAQPQKAQATLEKPPRAVAEARDERRKSKSRNTILHEVKNDVVVPSSPTLNTSARSVHRGSRGQSSAVSRRCNDELMDLLLK